MNKSILFSLIAFVVLMLILIKMDYAGQVYESWIRMLRFAG